jgi:hypothetical protein
VALAKEAGRYRGDEECSRTLGLQNAWIAKIELYTFSNSIGLGSLRIGTKYVSRKLMRQ